MPDLDSPTLGHQIVEPCATGLPMPRHLGSAIGQRMPGLDSPGLIGELVSCRTAASARTLLPTGFDFDDAPVNF